MASGSDLFISSSSGDEAENGDSPRLASEEEAPEIAGATFDTGNGDSDDYLPEDSASEASEFNDPLITERQRDYSNAASTPRIRDVKSPLKRPPGSHTGERLPKRQKRPFNTAYLDLLNEDIEDAATKHILDKRMKLRKSDVGITTWTSLEKELFFEALSRLGQDDLPGIAARVQSKSQLEVRQYLIFLGDALADFQKNLPRWEDVVEMASYPAAQELSLECCEALEEAADDLALRVERHEQRTQEKKWGECWSIDASLAKRIYRDQDFADEHELRFAELFCLPVWLKLSKNVFMNSVDPEDNWQYLDESPPRIRASALDDFYSLVVSVTRRLVLTSLYVAQSRIKAKRAVRETEDQVHTRDVEAAVESLGMKRDLQRYWALLPRRLRLGVYRDDAPSLGKDDDDECEDDNDDEQDDQPMAYEEVERALLPETGQESGEQHEGPRHASQIVHLVDYELHGSSIALSNGSERSGSSTPCSPERSGSETSIQDIEVREEVKEILMYSAYGIPQTHRTMESLEARVRRQREQEAYADAVDASQSYDGEMAMWKVLDRPPPDTLTKPELPERPKKSIRDIDEVRDPGRRWRDGFSYTSPWETLNDGGNR